MPRLPELRPATDSGLVYVVRHGNAYKIGFTRAGLRRRVRMSEGVLVLSIPVRQRPAQLEYALNRHFASKRLPGYKDNDGGKREWFALDADDLVWLQGFAHFVDGTV